MRKVRQKFHLLSIQRNPGVDSLENLQTNYSHSFQEPRKLPLLDHQNGIHYALAALSPSSFVMQAHIVPCTLSTFWCHALLYPLCDWRQSMPIVPELLAAFLHVQEMPFSAFHLQAIRASMAMQHASNATRTLPYSHEALQSPMKDDLSIGNSVSQCSYELLGVSIAFSSSESDDAPSSSDSVVVLSALNETFG